MWVVVLTALSWVVGWYHGKNAPSEIDTTEVAITEAVTYVSGGCFWCTESDYEKIDGVIDAVSGYMGGDLDSPSYKQVAGGIGGHRETVKVTYNPERVSYRRLALELFRETDPTDAGGSFYDRGHQYTSALYYKTNEEREIAEGVVALIEERGMFSKPIATAIEEVGTFWIAEDYHQDYYKKSLSPYKRYRKASGRDAFIQSIWGSGEYDDIFDDPSKSSVSKWDTYVKPSDSILKKTLTSIQYKITQKDGTERPFDNEYWDNHEDGIYVDVVSGEPLFSSTEKFDSGTGWPSFLRPIDYDFVTEHDDFKLIRRRTEIRSKYADSHIGHILLDGPVSNDKIRYCMNSAALRFVPVDDLEKEGLGEYMHFFN